MTIFKRIYYFFSRYVGSGERKVGLFFAKANERDNTQKIQDSLNHLLQRNVAVVNLWAEHRYKGYTYLNKRMRKQLYENLSLIKQDFETFSATGSIDAQRVIDYIAGRGIDTSMIRSKPDQLVYLVKIMQYLSPSRGKYVYRESSSFGRLLRNPMEETLEGDCNQIVTLYIALYSLKYDISDLQLTVFPGHVAIHFHGVDIETTSGQFAHYKKQEQVLTPVHEIVSINLLDTADINFDQSIVDPEVFLEAARLAYVVSSHRNLVKRNLEAAYNNTVRHLIEEGRYMQALGYAKQSTDLQLIEASVRGGVADAIKRDDYQEARKFSSYSQDKSSIGKVIDENEASYLFNNRKYEAAARLYKRLGLQDMVRQSYRGAYGEEQKKLKGAKSVADIKANAHTVRTMQKFAKASGDAGLQNHANGIAKYL